MNMLYFNFKVFIIKLDMIKNLIIGLFTHIYPVKIYAPPNWSEDEFIQYYKVRAKLDEIYQSKPSRESMAKDYFSELEKLPDGAIVSAYNKVIIRFENHWEKL